MLRRCIWLSRQEESIGAVYLHVITTNPPAHRFYESEGFVQVCCINGENPRCLLAPPCPKHLSTVRPPSSYHSAVRTSVHVLIPHCVYYLLSKRGHLFTEIPRTVLNFSRDESAIFSALYVVAPGQQRRRILV